MPGQCPHWLSSGTPAWTIVRRFGRKKSLTVQSKLPVPRSPLTSQLPGMTSTSARGNRRARTCRRRRGGAAARFSSDAGASLVLANVSSLGKGCLMQKINR